MNGKVQIASHYVSTCGVKYDSLEDSLAHDSKCPACGIIFDLHDRIDKLEHLAAWEPDDGKWLGDWPEQSANKATHGEYGSAYTWIVHRSGYRPFEVTIDKLTDGPCWGVSINGVVIPGLIIDTLGDLRRLLKALGWKGKGD